MPARNIVKIYIENGIYHVYNRGVDKKEIFLDHQDYSTFLRILKEALSAPLDRKMIQIDVTLKGDTFKGVPRQPRSFQEDIDLIAYCLMPNHFHLLIQQKKEKIMHEFLRSVSIRYAMYFNKKHHRTGPLFQNAYKAAIVLDEPYFLHVSRYIHLNPKEVMSNIEEAYSSYANFIGKRYSEWIKPNSVLSLFGPNGCDLSKKYSGYKEFVESFLVDSVRFLGTDILDDLER
jgi:putative transposase